MIVLDFETRSRADLTEVGSNVYAMDPSTQILSVSIGDTENGHEWNGIILNGVDELPERWHQKLADASLIAAQNAAFDRDIYKYIAVEDHGWPEIPDNRWYCTAVQARLNALPASLENAALAAKLINKKDFSGSALIKKLSIPQPDGSFNEDWDSQVKMLLYCAQDRRTTVELVRSTRQMTAQELENYHVNERINERGVAVDLELCELAQKYAAAEQAELSAALTKVTNGKITKTTQTQRVRDYLLDALDPKNADDMAVLKLMTVYKKGVKKYSLAKDIRTVILDLIESGELALYDDVEELIRLVDAGSMSSVAKFKRMSQRADPEDGRCRGAFVYAGAGQTTRYASRGLQLHNMVRDCFDEQETLDMIAKMRKGADIPNIMRVLSKLLRPALIPMTGHKYVVGDWSAIEARMLPWLAGTDEADKKLDVFRRGEDVYIAEALNMGMTEAERQIGKVAVLALGFGGANGAFISMAKNYGLILDDDVITRVVKQWRKSNAWAVKFWKQLTTAAMRAVRSGGIGSFKAGRVAYHFEPELLGGTLVCTLPDGSTIQYPECRIEQGQYGDQLSALKAGKHPTKDSTDGEWGRVTLWHGILAENITQAAAARLLSDALWECDAEGLPVVAHIHDEIVAEVPEDEAEATAVLMQGIMETPPVWATGLPLAAEPVILSRYGNH